MALEYWPRSRRKGSVANMQNEFVHSTPSQTLSSTYSLIPHLELGIETIRTRFATARRFDSFDLSLDDSV